ncbi:cobalamin-binding protein [Serinicoccus chungangensis]|uniref:Cobalamin-binding protein n=1 Tax=Serinicoccus chungangensis TaxID=767452 RepID=A0A0W8I5H0_9MICO|nr:helical backbone metal receptor [Serinicoccus chungangensis]KUG53487.1 cobalamin-binding protein [Serinicoccus chungangensis]
MRTVRDDLGGVAELPEGPVERVVSLVPSLTEALAATRPAALVGATDWCTHPADLDVARVRGTKNPDRRAVAALQPDLVVCVQEENRELDVQRLRAAGTPVWVGVVESVDDALRVLRRLLVEVLGWGAPEWLVQVERHWRGPSPASPGAGPAPARPRVAVPVWRDPWMVVGPRTFTSDLLDRAGLDNVYASGGERYPRVELADLDAAGADVALLPDEPYVFTDEDGPEAFARTPTRLVSGRLLTWYGPSMLAAGTLLDEVRAQAVAGSGEPAGS